MTGDKFFIVNSGDIMNYVVAKEAAKFAIQAAIDRALGKIIAVLESGKDEEETLHMLTGGTLEELGIEENYEERGEDGDDD